MFNGLYFRAAVYLQDQNFILRNIGAITVPPALPNYRRWRQSNKLISLILWRQCCCFKKDLSNQVPFGTICINLLPTVVPWQQFRCFVRFALQIVFCYREKFIHFLNHWITTIKLIWLGVSKLYIHLDNVFNTFNSFSIAEKLWAEHSYIAVIFVFVSSGVFVSTFLHAGN